MLLCYNNYQYLKETFKLFSKTNFQASYCGIVKSRRRVRSKMDIELKSRENPVVTKLDSPEFKSIFTPEVQELKALFEKYQYEIRIAGGAVRYLSSFKNDKL